MHNLNNGSCENNEQLNRLQLGSSPIGPKPSRVMVATCKQFSTDGKSVSNYTLSVKGASLHRTLLKLVAGCSEDSASTYPVSKLSASISCAWRTWTIFDDLTKAKNLPGRGLYTATLTMMMLLLLLVCVNLFSISLGLYHVDELPSNMSQGKNICPCTMTLFHVQT